jgi:hypothetical protein
MSGPSPPPRVRSAPIPSSSGAVNVASHSDKDSASTPSPVSSPLYRKGKHSVYVLSADGSALFLLDPSRPPPHEQPPPYHDLSRVSEAEASTVEELPTNSLGLTTGMSSLSSLPNGPIVPRTSSETGTRRQRASTTTAAVRRTRASSDASQRSSNWNAGSSVTSRPVPHLERVSSDYGPRRHHTRSDASDGLRGLADERTPLLAVPSTASPNRRASGTRSMRSISISSINAAAAAAAAASVPNSPSRPGPSSWRNMLRSNSVVEQPVRVQTIPTAQGGEAIVVTRPKKKRHWAIRYMRPLWSGAHWKALFHLVFLNFPMVR